MRIVLLTTQIPFVKGGAEMQLENFRAELVKAGHQAEIISLPFTWYPAPAVLDAMMAAQLTDVSETFDGPVDLAIGMKFPAYLARHPNKVYWVIHQHRQAFDIWDAGRGDLLAQPEGQMIREAIRHADTEAFTSSGLVMAESINVAQRLEKFCGVKSTPLYHPPPLCDELATKDYEDFFFFPSRLNPNKRQDLVIEALAKTSAPVKVHFSGNANSSYDDQLVRKAKELGVADRITWMGWIDEVTLLDQFARARAIIYPPVDEDYGYVTLQAMIAGKAVVTCRDSGGCLEFVRDRKSGIICEPSPEAMAAAMDELWEDKALAQNWGQNGAKYYTDHNISWETVISTLLAKPAKNFAEMESRS